MEDPIMYIVIGLVFLLLACSSILSFHISDLGKCAAKLSVNASEENAQQFLRALKKLPKFTVDLEHRIDCSEAYAFYVEPSTAVSDSTKAALKEAMADRGIPCQAHSAHRLGKSKK